MRKRVAILVAALAVLAPLFVTPPTEADSPRAIWVSRQVLRKGGLYHAAIDGTTVVITDYEWVSGTGRAFVFSRIGGTWVWQQTLTSPDPPPPTGGDGFGFAVDIHDEVIVVGQRVPMTSGGSVHVFEYRNGRWRHAARLAAAGGRDVTVWGDFIAASAEGWLGYPGAVGKISIYERLPSGWTLSQTLRRGRDGHHGCVFGYALDMWDGVLVAGDYYSHDPCAPYVHVYRRSGSTWSREQRLWGAAGNSHLEGWVAVWGDTIAVGDPDITGTDTAHRAKVRMFEWNGSKWVKTQIIRRNTQNFGDAVALHNDTLIVADATLERTWVYTRIGGTWQRVGRRDKAGTGRYVAVYGRHVISAGTGKAMAYRLNP